ncbi:hypothetical protein [Nocardioides sp.]|uniref:hypothetical protein n=1 Tax=Nocardioides sp. TaxID=35761 RepID=UPI00378445CF
MHRRPATRLTIRYPDGTAVRLAAGEPGATLDDGTTLTLTAGDLRTAACQLVAHGLATVTGPAELAATVTRPQLVAALAGLALATSPAHRSHAA